MVLDWTGHSFSVPLQPSTAPIKRFRNKQQKEKSEHAVPSFQGNDMTVGKDRVVFDIIELNHDHVRLHVREDHLANGRILARYHSCWIKRRRIGPQAENTLSNGESVIPRGTADSGIHSRKADDVVHRQHVAGGIWLTDIVIVDGHKRGVKGSIGKAQDIDRCPLEAPSRESSPHSHGRLPTDDFIGKSLQLSPQQCSADLKWPRYNSTNDAVLTTANYYSFRTWHALCFLPAVSISQLLPTNQTC